MGANRNRYLSSEPWLIREEGWQKSLQNVNEARFAQGNGTIGIRGVLEELPHDARPGTFFAGLYDRMTAQESDLVNLPNPLQFNLMVCQEKVGVAAMKVVAHKRWLDMRNGSLVRRTTFQDRHRHRYDYRSVRFVSMKAKSLIGMRVYFTPLDHKAEITVKSSVDVSVWNSGVLTEGNKRHFQLTQVFQNDKAWYLCVKTLEGRSLVAYATHLNVQVGRRKTVTAEQAFHLKLKKGQTACFTKLICMRAFGDLRPGVAESETMQELSQAVRCGFDVLLQRHVRTMHHLWKRADIEILGAPQTQKALRFNIYHMLIAGPEGEGEASIGARTLSGEGYRGHVFWDTEIFLMPFYIFTRPDVARSMLLYRYYRLDAARHYAKRTGYKGARFPWESAELGEEATPSWAKNFDGRIISVRTGALEQHITADVAYAVAYYATVTGDEEFMVRHGYEILFETGRFWASRVRFNRTTGRYEIRHVIGPDEFHENVDDNAFTNMMAKWNLRTAAAMYSEMRRRHPAAWKTLCQRLGLHHEEPERWRLIASRIPLTMRKDGIIEQFRGYFKRKSVRTPTLDKNDLPNIPVGLDLSEIGKTQFLKQADVVMLLHLLSSQFSRRIKERNYAYYLERTLHKSSLSLSAHAIVGCDIGEWKQAQKYFQLALTADLKNVNGNTDGGIHAASLGGVWQTVINGFGGVRAVPKGLQVNPVLPKAWSRLGFALYWRGAWVQLQVRQKRVEVGVAPNKAGIRVPMWINGRCHYVRPGTRRMFTYDSRYGQKRAQESP
jgi:kojibiose phosphorylase